jgi:hypothetical protein
LPFWKALDRLCVEGNLQYNLGMQGTSRSRQPILTLFAGRQAPAGPISDHGPFRVQLTNLHYQRHVTFAGGPRPSEQFYMQVQVVAEPRLLISQGGSIRIVEAMDDRGQSLVPPERETSTRESAYMGMGAGPIVQMQAHLKRPEQPGAAIRKVRGIVSMTVATRKADPLVVPLAGASGKSFRNDQVSLTVQEVRANPNGNQTMIHLVLRSQGGPGGATDVPGNRFGEVSLHPPDLNQQQFEVIDAKGQTIPCYPTSIGGDAARIIVTLMPPDGVTVPTELRYYSLARATTEAPFEFTDLMMP